MFKKTLLLGAMLMLLAGCPSNMNKKTNTPPTESASRTSLPDLSDETHGQTHVVKLRNGLTVLIKEDNRFPLVNSRLYVHAGSAYESPDIAGISHQLEHMVFKGTEKRAMGESAREIESIGGSMNAATSFDYTVYYAEVPDEKWKTGLDVITDMAFNPTIDPNELESEKKVVLEELDRGEDSPGSKLFKTLQGMIWKDTSYEWPIIGYRETVSGLSRDDILDYIARYYQPQSMLLAVVGNVDPQQVLAEAERLLGDLKNTNTVVPPEPFVIPEVGEGPRVRKIEGNWNKVYLGAAFPIPHATSGEVVPLDMLSQLMGGDDTSLLYRKFKYEKQLVDTISMSALTLERGGIMYVHAILDTDKVQQFWTELMEEMANFDADRFTDREIQRARLNLEDSLFQSKETLSGLAGKVGYFQFFENGEQAEENYLFGLTQVDREKMQAMYEKYIRPDQLATCIVTPEGAAVTPDSLTAITNEIWPVQKDLVRKMEAAKDIEPREIKLPGGNTLILLPDETLPYTAISTYWAGGDGELTPNQEGLAALTARALTRGTMSMSATEVQDFLSDHAASLGSSAGRNVFAVESKFPTRFTDEILPLITEVLTAPAFTPDEIERAKLDQIAAIKRREDQPLGLAFRHLFPFLYKSGPYAMLHQGTTEEVAGMTQSDIMRFWGRQSMQPFTMAVCGQFDPKVIEQFAASLSKTVTAPGQEYQFVTPQWGTERETTMTLPDRNQAHLIMAFPTPGKLDKDTSARLALLKSILAGQSGLLFSELRDKQGLAYTVTSLTWQSLKTGFMALYIGTSPDKVDESMTGFRKVLTDLATTPLPETELERARNILVGDYFQGHQSLISRSRQAASLTTRKLDREYELDIIERAKHVTAKDLQDLVQEYLQPDKAYVMTIKP